MSTGSLSSTRLSCLQTNNLDNIQRRVAAGLPNRPFMMDMATRCSPESVLDHYGFIAERKDETPGQDLETSSWLNIRVETDVIYAPYRKAANLLIQRSKKPLSEEKNAGVESFSSIWRHFGISNFGIAFTSVVSAEAMNDRSHEEISTSDAVESFIAYSDQTEPYQRYEYSSLLWDSHGAQDVETHHPEVIAVIPVASGQEHDNLEKTVRELAKQSLDPSLMSLYFVHNSTQRQQTVSETENTKYLEVDNDEEEWARELYQRIYQDFPNLRIKAFLLSGNDGLKIGQIRRVLARRVLEDYLTGDAQNNPYMLNLDADIDELNDTYLQNILDTAERTNKPVIGTRLEWTKDQLLEEAPTAAKILDFSQAAGDLSASIKDKPRFYDCGTAIRLKEYCLAGGHDWFAEFYETGSIVHRIKEFTAYKGSLPEAVVTGGESRFKTNPRRQIATMLKGLMPDSAWDRDTTTFGEPNDPVRTTEYSHPKLEVSAKYHELLWIEDIVTLNFGDFESDLFLDNVNRIDKILQELGLPSIDKVIREKEEMDKEMARSLAY